MEPATYATSNRYVYWQSSQTIIAINLKLGTSLRRDRRFGRWLLVSSKVDFSWNSYLSIAKGTLRATALFVTHLRTRRKPVPDFKRCIPFSTCGRVSRTQWETLRGNNLCYSQSLPVFFITTRCDNGRLVITACHNNVRSRILSRQEGMNDRQLFENAAPLTPHCARPSTKAYGDKARYCTYNTTSSGIDPSN